MRNENEARSRRNEGKRCLVARCQLRSPRRGRVLFAGVVRVESSEKGEDNCFRIYSAFGRVLLAISPHFPYCFRGGDEK